MLLKNVLMSFIAISILLLVLAENDFAEGTLFMLPNVKVQSIPSENDFLNKERLELLKDHEKLTIIRENGEKIDAYFLHTSTPYNFIMIFYFEDKTSYSLENYVPFNSDFFTLYLKTDASGADERFIYGERNGRGCMMPIKDFENFWTGVKTSCEGGAVVTKKTKDGWAAYVKFFVSMPPNTVTKPYFILWSYGDIQETKDNQIIKLKRESWPTDYYASIVPLSNVVPQSLKANSGKISIPDLLYKPSKILTQDLQKNVFPCADNTITITNDKENYDAKYDVVRIIVKINSNTEPKTIYLKVYDSNGKIVHESSHKALKNQDNLFLIDLDNFLGGIYTAVAEYGINGPKSEIKFSLGNVPIPKEEQDDCYFYLLYDKQSKNLSFLAFLKDSSFSQNDELHLFIDKNGDSGKFLNSDDLFYTVDKQRFGAHRYYSDGGWKIWKQYEEKGEGRIKITSDKYQVLINIPDVSENYNLSLYQIDDTNLELKTARYPENSFSTVPASWSNSEIVTTAPKKLAADKWKPNEILLQQKIDINMILVGESWKPTLIEKIKKDLQSNYKPIVASELERLGIQYDFQYNFVSTSEQANKDLFEFMKKEAVDVKPFFGENDYDNPWGIALWIKNNHTEWVDQAQERYDVEYKLIDAEKMEDYIYQNIIAKDAKLNKANSANLIFISDDMSKIKFLHNYQVKRTDPSTKAVHNAVGLMGYGGRHNLYFFDLYAVPWHGFQGIPGFYDRKLQNFATNLHDIKTEENHADLISDYVNNATSLLITPSYLYSPVFRNHYVLDLVIVAKTDTGSGTATNTLIGYFIDQNKIKSQLESLIPNSQWEIKITLENLQSRNIPDNLKQVIQTAKKITPFEENPNYTIDILDTKKVTEEVTQWATTRTSSNFRDFRDIQESSWTIPVMITIGNRDKPVYLYQDGATLLGIAPGHPDDPTQPCCAMAVTYDNAVWDDKVSVTDLVLHEVGHTLGLMHPFMGFSSEDEFFDNQYFNWYGSVMGYNSPPDSCGQWYNQYVGSSCGIANTYFTKFETDNMAKGITVYLLKSAKNNLYRTMINLENDGKDLQNLPTDVKKSVDTIDSKLKEAENALLYGDINSEKGAIRSALEAAIESEKLAKRHEVSYESTLKPQERNLQIPEWIKDTARWWSSDAISESEFINAIQYLIKERIIVIPDIPESGTSVGQKVPQWVKNNAEWWSDGKISDSDFVTALQYLIKEGIIKLDE